MNTGRKAARPRARAARPKVFISHATSDRRRAERLGRVLAQHDLPYWFSREHLVHGHNWYRDIGKALQSCKWLIVVCTRDGVRSKWVRDEVTYALLDSRYQDRVIPLFFENCNLKRLAWSLQSIQYIDFRQGWQPGTNQLLRRLGKRLPRRHRD